MKTAKTFLSVVLLVLVVVSGAAQSQMLLFPRGTKNIAMGGAGAADISSPVSGYYNPAALAWTNGIFLETNYHKFLDFYSYLDTRITAGKEKDNFLYGGLLGFTAEYLVQDCMYSTYSFGCEPFDEPNYYLSAGFAAAKRAESLSAGLGIVVKELKYRSGAQYSSMAVDIGAILSWTAETEEGYKIRSTFGASARNISGDIEVESEDHEWTIDQMGESRYGLGMELSTPPAASVSKKLGRDVSAFKAQVLYDLVRGFGSNEEMEGWGVGMEVALFETLFIRVGNSKDLFALLNYMNLGLGLGWQHPARGIVLRLDYAMMEPPETAEEFYDRDMTDHMIGLVIGKVF